MSATAEHMLPPPPVRHREAAPPKPTVSTDIHIGLFTGTPSTLTARRPR